MATALQEDLARAVIENRKLPRHKRKNKKELLISVGYALGTANSIPGDVIESKGVRDTFAKWGLTEELITSALVYDIENKPKKRVKELGLGADILGMKKQQDGNTTNILNIYASEQTKRIARRILNDQPESESTSD